MDMLSVRKERLHGMRDQRWNTKDKIVQYKGLINLYRRDQKISNTDRTIMSKKAKTMVARLKKRMANTYELLDSALFGDRQKIKNVLASDRRIQLACQLLPAGVIKEHIGQDNFTLRKKLDLMQYQKVQQLRRLVKLKLEVSEFEDIFKHYQPGSLPIEKRSSEFTALVQDANLKKEAAIVVNESYKKIISVMKKDQIYFDQILTNLYQDAKRQSKCMVDTIKLGQLAVEYLDDRKEDFKCLEQVVQTDMQTRKKTVALTRDIVQSVSKHIKYYIRRDSEVDIATLSRQPSQNDLHKEVAENENLLNHLKKTFLVNDYTDLVKYVQMQHTHHIRLRNLTDRTYQGKERLVNRMNHGVLMYSEMQNTMSEGTQNYVKKKQELKAMISHEEQRCNNAVKQHHRCSKVMNDVKICLQQMEQICKVIVDPNARVRPAKTHGRGRLVSTEKLQMDIEDIKDDCAQIIQILEPKLSILVNTGQYPITNERERTIADSFMQQLAHLRALSVIKHKYVAQTEYMSGMFEDAEHQDDATILTRADIKANSKDIVQVYLANAENMGRLK